MLAKKKAIEEEKIRILKEKKLKEEEKARTCKEKKEMLDKNKTQLRERFLEKYATPKAQVSH